MRSKIVLKRIFTSILALFVGFCGIVIWIFWDIPDLDTLEGNLATPSVRFVDRKGRVLYNLINDAQGHNSPVSFETIPIYLVQATIATEDQNFFHHPGVDFFGILRSIWINLQGGETLAGGSTITQQVARNLLLSEAEQFNRTFRRKIREAWLAWRITEKYSHDEIIVLYLNQMYYGAMAYGVEAAAQAYFGRSVNELNLAECALLAGIPQAPAFYNPFVYPDAAKNRQRTVLDLMLHQGYITSDEREVASRQELIYSSSPYPIEAPHFVMYVIVEVDQLLQGQVRNPEQPLIVQTTLDLDLQHLAEKAIEKQLRILSDEKPARQSSDQSPTAYLPGGHNVDNAALIAIDPKSGAVVAMVGSQDFFDPETAGAINMSITPRQPGSALKPIIYAAAFSPEFSEPLTPASMILDIDTAVITREGSSYVPANFDNLEHGPVSARQALGSSLNIPAVIVLNEIGFDRFFDLASKLGISTLGNPSDYDLSLALGGGEVTLFELTAAYASIANQGIRVEPFTIDEIRTNEGQIVYQHKLERKFRVLDDRVAWLISDILSDNNARLIGFGPNTVLNLDRPAAVKTGTTTNFHDNWTIGYTPDLVTGIWVGNTNHEPMKGVSGLSGAGPIWHQFMREALTGTMKNWYTRPGGLIEVEVCTLSGQLPSKACPHTKSEWFIQGTEPKLKDTLFHDIWLDKKTGTVANESTTLENRFSMTVLDLPPQAYAWAKENGIPLLVDYLSKEPKHLTGPDNSIIKIITPGDQSIFLLSKTLSNNIQKIHIQIGVDYPFEEVLLWLDGKLITSLSSPSYETWWEIQLGDHTLWAEGHHPDYGNFRSQTTVFNVISEP